MTIFNDNWFKSKREVKDEIKLFPVKEEEVQDIDYQWQFDLCEKLWK